MDIEGIERKLQDAVWENKNRRKYKNQSKGNQRKISIKGKSDKT